MCKKVRSRAKFFVFLLIRPIVVAVLVCVVLFFAVLNPAAV